MAQQGGQPMANSPRNLPPATYPAQAPRSNSSISANSTNRPLQPGQTVQSAPNQPAQQSPRPAQPAAAAQPARSAAQPMNPGNRPAQSAGNTQQARPTQAQQTQAQQPQQSFRPTIPQQIRPPQPVQSNQAAPRPSTQPQQPQQPRQAQVTPTTQAPRPAGQSPRQATPPAGNQNMAPRAPMTPAATNRPQFTPGQPQPPMPPRAGQPAPGMNRVVPAAAGVVAGAVAANAANAAGRTASNSAPLPAKPAPISTTTTPKVTKNTPPPPPAPVSKSILRFLPFVLVGLLILVGGFFLASRFLFNRGSNTQTNGSLAPATKQVTLTYWGLWEPTTVMADVIKDYEASNPGVKINYQQQSYQDYRERLQTAVAGQSGPDIFRFHASWVPMLVRELSPMPDTVYTQQDFQSKFYPAAVEQLTINNTMAGVPLMYDGLALYYNTDVLRTANVSPPTTWAELRTLAKQLTVRSSYRKIERAGAALGNATNVEHFSDIIALLMLQNGATLDKPNSQAAQEAIKFYTDFYTVDKVWDDTLPSSTVAFARGEAAMMLAPSWRAHEIKAQNPNLNFSIVPVPQLSARKVAWASYWAEGVSQSSRNKAEAWKFVKYLSSPETLRKFYSSASQTRPFGEIYPQRDMVGDVASDPYISAYLIDAQYAKGGFMSSFTHDNGINDNIMKYYEDAVSAMITGKQPAETMPIVEQGVLQELRQYGLAPAEVAPVVQ